MAAQEHETKILNIDIPAFKQRLNELGFICNLRRHLVRRWVFSLPNKQDNAWVRIIDNSEGRTRFAVTYKSYESYQIGGIKECELIINGELPVVRDFLERLGCSLIAEQHSYEEQYLYPGQKNVKIDIQEWPLIPPYAEVEGQNEDEVIRILTRLGFKSKDSRPITTKMVYEKYGINLHDYQLLTFDHN